MEVLAEFQRDGHNVCIALGEMTADVIGVEAEMAILNHLERNVDEVARTSQCVF